MQKVDTAQVNSYPSSDNNEDEIPHVQFNQPQSEMFMLCHQTEWQRKILSRYGQELCFLDATYKTTKYALPLFFLVVKTNVSYTVVESCHSTRNQSVYQRSTTKNLSKKFIASHLCF